MRSAMCTAALSCDWCCAPKSNKRLSLQEVASGGSQGIKKIIFCQLSSSVVYW
jgi:hypothetical protein